jgi:hypothetical protein
MFSFAVLTHIVSLLHAVTSASELAKDEFLSETRAYSFRRANGEIAKHQPDVSI